LLDEGKRDRWPPPWRSFPFVVKALSGGQQLYLRAARHEALAFLEHLRGVPCGIGHHRYPDLDAPIQVKVTRLGDRDTREAATELRDERPDDAPLLFQRVDIAKQHIERQSGYVHEVTYGDRLPGGH
jgi:hypothetical protein